MKETWKDWNYMNFHALVSTTGRIVNKKTGHELVPQIHEYRYKSGNGMVYKTPYIMFRLSKKLAGGNKTKGYKVARIVAETFIPNPENKRIVNHIDDNPMNNNVDNLEWATDKENVAWANRNGRCIRLCNKDGISKYFEEIKKRIVNDILPDGCYHYVNGKLKERY
jgi:hypothetical protein